jgi:hypothetical protein
MEQGCIGLDDNSAASVPSTYDGEESPISSFNDGSFSEKKTLPSVQQ